MTQWKGKIWDQLVKDAEEFYRKQISEAAKEMEDEKK